MGIATTLLDVLVFVLSSLPLYFAVRFLGGKTGIVKAVLVNFVVGLLVSVIRDRFALLGGLLAFVIMVWIYHEIFRLRWIKAFLVWLVQIVIIALFYLILALIFGLTILAGILPNVI